MIRDGFTVRRKHSTYVPDTDLCPELLLYYAELWGPRKWIETRGQKKELGGGGGDMLRKVSTTSSESWQTPEV